MLLLALALAADPPPRLTHDDARLLLSKDAVWFTHGSARIRLDLTDGRVLESAQDDPTRLGGFTLTKVAEARNNLLSVGFGTGTFQLAGVRFATLAGDDLLLATPDTLTRVHPDGTQESTRAKGIRYAVGLPNGGIAYTGEDLTIRGKTASCDLTGPKGPVMAPEIAGDPVVVRDANSVLLVSMECEPVAMVPIKSRAAALTADTLWILTSQELLRFPWRSGKLGAPERLQVSANPAFEARGDALAMRLGTLVWDPFAGTITSVAAASPAASGPAAPYDTVGARTGDLGLRLTPTGTRVVNLTTGRDVGVEIPRWARQGLISTDGRLVLLVDEPASGPRSALLEVATGRELWVVTRSMAPILLTSRALVWSELGAKGRGEPAARLVVDTATGTQAYTLTSTTAISGSWIDAVLTGPDGTILSLQSGKLPAWPAVVAPVPLEGAAADDPLHRATNPPAAVADPARVAALQGVLGTTAANPLEALLPPRAWPPRSEGAVIFSTERKPLSPGRSVAGLTNVRINTNPVTLPLRPERPVLVIIGDPEEVPARILDAAADPDIDLLFGLSEEAFARRMVALREEGEAEGLWAFTLEHDPAQTVEVGDFGDDLAVHLGLPNPGAMFVDKDGRVLAEGTLREVADRLRWRDLGAVKLPKPEAATWRYRAAEPVTQVAALLDGAVAFRSERTVGVLNADGSLRWTRDERRLPRTTGLWTMGDVVMAGSRDVRAWSAKDGADAWQIHGSLGAVGDGWALLDGPLGDFVVGPDGKGHGLLPGMYEKLEAPSASGDVLWFDGPEGWRCGQRLDLSSSGCAPGQPIGRLVVGRDGDDRVAWNADGDEVWRLSAPQLSVEGDRFLVQLGTATGPWVAIDGKGKPTQLLLTDAMPALGPAATFGTVDGDIVAWGRGK